MRQSTRSQLDYHCLLPFLTAQFRRNGGGFYPNQEVVTEKLDHQNLNEVLPFNPTAENIARWVCKQIPQCYKVEVQESEGNIVIYEKDAAANEKTPAAGETE